MQINISGKNMDTGAAFQEHAEAALTGAVSKYFDNAISANITLMKSAVGFETHLRVVLTRRIDMEASGKASDAHASLDEAVEHIEKRLRRYKRRLKNHRVDNGDVIEATLTTFESAATSSYQVGLNYTVQAKTMPTEPVLASGSVQGVKKRIVQVDAIVSETKDMTINGKQISFRNFGESVLDTAVQPFTGVKTAHGILGYSATGQITIGQTVPLSMTVLGLEYKLSVGS